MLEFYASRVSGMMDLVSVWSVMLGLGNPDTNDEVLRSTREQISQCGDFCRQLNLPVSAEAFRQLELNFFADAQHGWPREQQIRFRYARDCLQTELAGKIFVAIDPRHTELYRRVFPFGEVVNRKFKNAVADIQNAGNCLAVGQPTACVMHLARAMEIALRTCATRLKVKIGGKDTIGSILNNMTPKINAMPDKTVGQKRKKELWAEARVHLFHVKQAWRDNSMHGRRDYSEAHAMDIYSAVRAFMAHLASL